MDPWIIDMLHLIPFNLSFLSFLHKISPPKPNTCLLKQKGCNIWQKRKGWNMVCSKYSKYKKKKHKGISREKPFTIKQRLSSRGIYLTIKGWLASICPCRCGVVFGTSYALGMTFNLHRIIDGFFRQLLLPSCFCCFNDRC